MSADDRTWVHTWTPAERGEQLDELAHLCDQVAEVLRCAGHEGAADEVQVAADEAERLLQQGYRQAELTALVIALPSYDDLRRLRAEGQEVEPWQEELLRLDEELSPLRTQLRSSGERRIRPRREQPEEQESGRPVRPRLQLGLVLLPVLVGISVDLVVRAVLPETQAASATGVLLAFFSAVVVVGLLVRRRRR